MKSRAIPVLLFLLLLSAGCGAKEETVVTSYNGNCLWNMQLARDYAAAGRHELAKEHYLMALAAANDVPTRNMLAGEIKSMDKMIQAKR